MSLLLPTNKKAVLHAATPVSIHGQQFVDVLFSFEDEPDSQHRTRVGSTDVEGKLEPGCAVTIHFVMGVATSVRRIPD